MLDYMYFFVLFQNMDVAIVDFMAEVVKMADFKMAAVKKLHFAEILHFGYFHHKIALKFNIDLNIYVFWHGEHDYGVEKCLSHFHTIKNPRWPPNFTSFFTKK